MPSWLMKSEPSEVSIDDALAAPNATVPWTGVRNFQARNMLRDEIKADLQAWQFVREIKALDSLLK